jgi:hypothetical protein
VNAAVFIAVDAVKIREKTESKILRKILETYNVTLTKAFLTPIITGGIAFIVIED